MSAEARSFAADECAAGPSRKTRPWLRAVGAEWWLIAAALAWGWFGYVSAYAQHYAVRRNPAMPDWWNWTDQGRYYRAIEAWAQLSLDPSQHWYFAGYPLLGATFFRLWPGHPLYAVDAACLLLFGWALCLLTRHLCVRPRLGLAVGAGVFLVTVVLKPYELKSFVEPWSSTPTAPLSLAALLLTMRLWDRPSPGRAAAMGLCTACIFLFRPTDTLPLGLAILVMSAVALRHLSPRELVRLAAAASAAGALPLIVAGATYVKVFGWHQSQYLEQSAQTGFEWRLLPLRWVILFVSPLPEFREEFSMAQTFGWIIPGVAGMISCMLICTGQARQRHALVISATLLHTLLYLAYRDLHPQGLFRFANYHYFKWCIPVFGIYAILPITEMTRRRRWIASYVTGWAVAAFLFSWRMEWQVVAAAPIARIEGSRTLLLSQAPRGVMDALFVPADGGFSQIYLASYNMRIGARIFASNADFKAFPVPGGLVLMPLRPLPGGPVEIEFDEAVTLRHEPVQMRRAHLFIRRSKIPTVVKTYIDRWIGIDPA